MKTTTIFDILKKKQLDKGQVAEVLGAATQYDADGSRMTEEKLMKTDVILEHIWYKLGGLSGRKRQKRNVKIHKNGWLSYHDGSKFKGFFRLGKKTICEPGNNGPASMTIRVYKDGYGEGEKSKNDKVF